MVDGPWGRVDLGGRGAMNCFCGESEGQFRVTLYLMLVLRYLIDEWSLVNSY